MGEGGGEEGCKREREVGTREWRGGRGSSGPLSTCKRRSEARCSPIPCLACLPACLQACLPACLPVCRPGPPLSLTHTHPLSLSFSLSQLGRPVPFLTRTAPACVLT